MTASILRCIACSRPLKRAAGMVGKHPIGPKCLRKVLVLKHKTPGDKPDQKQLFEGCYFDIQGEAARLSLEGRNA